MPNLRVLVVLLALTAATPASGIAPYLVRDINPTTQPASSSPSGFISLGDLVLFWSGPYYSHASLWRTDGTTGGTFKLLENIWSFWFVGVAEGRYFFICEERSSSSNSYLWVTDGSLPGTFRLSQTPMFTPYPYRNSVWVPEQRTLFFAAHSPSQTSPALWRTDGTPGGTYQVMDVKPDGSGSNPRELTSFQGRLYFVADGPSGGLLTLWRSDGTAEGTVLIPNTAPVLTEGSLYKIGSRLVFTGFDPAHGAELWVSNGTPKGTRLLVELVEGDGSPAFLGFAVHAKRLYFLASLDSATPQLWVTDGTVKGTRILTHFDKDPGDILLPQTQPPNRFVFVASDPVHGTELWSTDGTEQGTRLVRDICPGVCSGLYASSSSFALHKGWLYFRASNPARGMELWVTNGTGRGTRLVRDICPGDCSSYPTDLISMKSRLLFRANDGLHSSQIWATDGTSPGTVILSDFDVYNESLHGAAAGSIFIFSAVESSHGREPWCTDGTSEGTYLLADLADEDLGGSHPGSLMAMGNTALFFADDGKHGYELWKSDGTAEGTDLVAELQAGASQTGRPEVPNWTSSAGRAFFFLEQTTGGLAGGNVKFPPPPKKFALWTSDGTAAGTYRLTSEGVLGISSVSPTRLPLTSLVFFSASDAEHGAEPWVTDGTTEGTHILADLEPGSASSFPSNFFVFQRKIWFMLSQGTTQRLWQSDGTAAGTVPLEASDLLWDKSLLVFHQQLWFRVRGDDGNGELWSTDGTTAGTRLRVALDFYPYEFFTDGDRLYLSGGGASWVSDGTPGGTLRFSGSTTTGVWVRCGSWLYYDSVEGLFVTDGTVAGTRALRPVNNETIERIHNLICLGHSVLALTEGRKLWQTNGTDAGTTMVGELLAEPDGTSVKLLQAGPRVFFPAWDPKTGWELWAAQE